MKTIKKIAKFIFVFAVIFSWIFGGWPEIWNFPPKVQEAKATTTTNSPTANTGSWTNPTNAYADGTSYANITSGSPSATHTYGTYGFSLTGNTITQVRVRMDALSIGGAITTTANNYPTSDESNTAAFTVSPLWSNVDDTSDTDYITGVTNGGGHATFGFTAFNIPAGSTIIDIKIYWSQKSTGTGANGAASLKVGGTYYDGLGSSATTAGFVAKSYTASLNPKTSAAWTVAEVNGTDATNPLQAFGVSGTDFNPDVQFGYVYAKVTYITANDETIEMDVSWDGGTNWSSSKHQQPLTDTETTYWVDVTSDTSWTPTKLSDANFKVRVDGLTVGDSGNVRLDWVPVEVTYVSLPTVTTQAAGSVEATTATGNGTIEATGGENASAWGVCYKTSSGCTTADSTAAGSGTGGAGAFTASMTTLLSNTTYYIKAYATNSAGTGYGGEVTILTKPGAPTSLNFTSVTATTLRLNWTAPTGGAASYKVERCTGTGCSSWAEIATGVTNAYYDDSGRTGNTIYRYQVRATNATGDGAYSSGAEQLMLPDVPGTPTFSGVTDTSITVNWTDPVGGAASYKVERAPDSGGAPGVFAEVGAGVSSPWTNNTGITCNTTYWYRVRATNATGDGSYSGNASQLSGSCNEVPALSISQPDGTSDTVVAGVPYDITYSLSDPDDTVTVAFYYDTNTDKTGGVAIASPCAAAAEGSNVTCAWNTTGVAAGSYYVYGITNDGVNPQVDAVSSGTITINAQSLTFSISNTAVYFGTLSASAARYATSGTGGSASDTADAHTLSASTNASSGYVIKVNGTTLTHTDISYTVTAIGGTAAASNPGNEQFGMRLIVNSGSGTRSAPYNTVNWALDTASFPDEIASGSGDGATTVFGVRYIANISGSTEAGSYSASLNYVATATF